MTVVNLCIVTRNKALTVTTLHTAMNLHMFCMSNGIQLDINFLTDKTSLYKQMKTCDRLIWIDYGTSVDLETLKKFVGDFPDGYKILVAPCVLEGVDWNLFRKKTLEGNTEPLHQRGLKFDTEYTPGNKQVVDFISSVTDGRVFAIDTKPVLKKLREVDSQYKSLDHLKKNGVKIGVLRSSPVICHYVYESIGNILESSGVKAGP